MMNNDLMKAFVVSEVQLVPTHGFKESVNFTQGLKTQVLLIKHLSDGLNGAEWKGSGATCLSG